MLVLAPLFAWMWVRLGARQPSSGLKSAYGLILVGVGFLVLVPAAARAQETGVRVSPMWLTATYLIHTFGELSLSPVGLSLVTRLSPRQVVGLMMGVWFLAASLGNKIAGWVASFFDVIPVARLFTYVVIATIAGGIVLLLFSKPVKKLSGEA